MARFTGPVRFFYKGDLKRGHQLQGFARKYINQIGNPSRRERGANGMHKVELSDGSTIVVSKSGSVYNAIITIPEKEGADTIGAGFVIYPYTGWMYPAYRDRRPNASTGFTAQTQPAYYTKKQETIPTDPYWLDTKGSYVATKPTKYKIAQIAKKDANIKYDPIYAQFLEDTYTWVRDEDDQYSHYSHWNDGELVEGEWQAGSWHLHWANRPTGDIVNSDSLDYRESAWGKFIYVNGVKFPCPGYVYGGAVYYDEATKSNWLVVTTWYGELESAGCLHDEKANVWITRLTSDDNDIPVATNDDTTITTTEFYNAQLLNQPDLKELSRNWFPLNDVVAGFTIPRNATNKGSYSATCGAGWEGEKYLNIAFGFKFNQNATKFSYVAVIEGSTANEFNEFTLSYVINNSDGYLIPNTFSEALTASDYVTSTIANNSTRYDGTWHDYQSDKMYIGLNYKENVLQKLQGTIRAKFVLFADKTEDFRETYVERDWYINDVLLGSQSLSKIYTGLNYADKVWVSTSESGNYYLYYDLNKGDYIKEDYTVAWVSTDTYTITYDRSMVVFNTIIGTDSGSHTLVHNYGVQRVGWPMDEFSDYPWKANGSINALVIGGGGGEGTTNTIYFYAPLSSLYTDRVGVGYHWLGGGGPGHLTVNYGHPKGHIAGHFVSRSINAGPNGLYFIDTPSPFTYVFDDTDHRFRVKQHLFAFNVNNADRLYSEYGVRANATENTVPVINTCFYRRKNKWDKV